jgi:hypothetical protein
LANFGGSVFTCENLEHFGGGVFTCENLEHFGGGVFAFNWQILVAVSPLVRIWNTLVAASLFFSM